jgi:carbon storage regulator
LLVLSRKIDESLIINDNIKITVLAVDGDRVKIGIDAPRSIPILREELHKAVKEQDSLAERLATGPEPETFDKLRNLLVSETTVPEEVQKRSEGDPEEEGEDDANIAEGED